MYRGLRVGVSVPAHNEENLIARVIQTMPCFVDLIVVVDDRSSDRTSDVVTGLQATTDKRVELVRHAVNTGVGGAVCHGYARAYEAGMDVVAVMAGDAQMDPEDLPKVLDPIVDKRADYVKGNRLIKGDAWRSMPRHRFFGNHILTLLTKIASGYWHITDSQCGYTALSRRAIELLELDRIAKGYAFENSLLIHLNVAQLPVVNVPVKSVYGIGEKSGIRVWRVTAQLSWYLIKAFFWRLWEKYTVRDFHPLVFFYLSGLIMLPIGFVLGTYLLAYRVFVGPVAATSALFALFLTISGWQFLLFAMWFDLEAGRRES